MLIVEFLKVTHEKLNLKEREFKNEKKHSNVYFIKISRPL